MKKRLVFCVPLAGALVFFGLYPLHYRIFHVGNVLLLLMGLAVLVYPLLWELGRQRRWLKTTTRLLYGFGVGAVFLLSAMMLVAAYGNKPPETGRQTVIVLGAGLVYDQPSRMLARRLDVAADYLKRNPEAVCIVSGGQGADEIVPEGEAMFHYLVRQGIEPQRIQKETQSVNTRQNLRFSSQLIDKESQGVVIVSDAFHQKRAAITAKTLGMSPQYALSSLTELGLLPASWMRDLPGIPLTWFEERVLKADGEIFTRGLGGVWRG